MLKTKRSHNPKIEVHQKWILVISILFSSFFWCENTYADCVAPWDEKQMIREGDHVWAYVAPTGDHLGKCRKQQRICRGGELLGNYDFKECVFKHGCTTEFGFIPEGGEITAYHSPTGDQEDGACLAEKRYCSKGTFTGSFSFLACQPRVDKKSNKPSVVFKD